MRRVRLGRVRLGPGAFRPKDVAPIVRLWILRTIFLLKAHRKLLQTRRYTSGEYVGILGLDRWLNEDGDLRFESSEQIQQAWRVLRDSHREAEENAAETRVPTALRANVRRIGTLAGLSRVGRRVLEFTTLLHHESALEDATDLLGDVDFRDVVAVVATLLDQLLPEVCEALAPRGVLENTGLVSVDHEYSRHLTHKLDLMDESFSERMMDADLQPLDLLRKAVGRSAPSELTLDAYPHLREDLAILRPLLERAIADTRRGVNVFFHGPPGTGKTQLVGALAIAVGADLLEVSASNGDNDAIGSDRRLRACRAAQALLAKGRSLLLFDEAEDVFPSPIPFSSFLPSVGARKSKAWMNRLLERNPIPTIWVSNTLAGVDPAHVRRFDYVLKVPIPPKSVRENILHNACGELIETETMARVAESTAASPAVVTRAARVAHLVQEDLPDRDASKAFELMVNNALEAQGHATIKRHDPNRLPDNYSLEFVNASGDPAAVVDALGREKRGRLCLYGPPGTGKTAYGRWIAKQMDAPLVIRRASDLLAPFLGQTEQSIAAAFRKAEREGALLLMDEVEG